MAEKKESQTVVSSGLFNLNWRDLIQGAIMAGIGAVAALVIPLFEKGDYEIDFNKMWRLALVAAVAHLLRKLLSPPAVVITNPTPTEVRMVKEGEATAEIKKT